MEAVPQQHFERIRRNRIAAFEHFPD
jgi:hypothetical protein